MAVGRTMSYSFSFDLNNAIASALQKIDANLVTFAKVYPHDTTLDNVYPPRKLGSHPKGSNVGWTTGFWPGMIWLAYERTGDGKYRAAGEQHIQRPWLFVFTFVRRTLAIDRQ
jgi:hypothetical protein